MTEEYSDSRFFIFLQIEQILFNKLTKFKFQLTILNE